MNYLSCIALSLLFLPNNVESFEQKNLYAAAGIGVLSLAGMHWFSLYRTAQKITNEEKKRSSLSLLQKSNLLKNYFLPYCPLLYSVHEKEISQTKINEKKACDSIESKLIFKKYKFPFLFCIEHTLNIQYKIKEQFGSNIVDQDYVIITGHLAQAKPLFYTLPLLSFFSGWMCARAMQAYPESAKI